MRHPVLSSVAALALCGLVSGQSNVVVNEVLYDPVGVDSGNEIIEVANLGTAAQVLTGWSICVGYAVADRHPADQPGHPRDSVARQAGQEAAGGSGLTRGLATN